MKTSLSTPKVKPPKPKVKKSKKDKSKKVSANVIISKLDRKGIRGKESASRINFLFQASKEVGKINPKLSQFYGKVLQTVSEKTSVKLDYTLKRFVCKGCRGVLIPGETSASFRIRPKKSRRGQSKMVSTCKNCGTKKIQSARRRNEKRSSSL